MRSYPDDVIDGLVSFWDFQEPSGPFMSKIGTGRYALEESSITKGTWTSNGTVERVQDSPPSKPFGPLSASIKPNQIIEVLFDTIPPAFRYLLDPDGGTTSDP